MKNRLALVAILGFALGFLCHTRPGVAADESTTAALEVMTYNIRTGKANDGLDAWNVRSPRTIAVIEKYKPDVLGLQEAHEFQALDLVKAMPKYNVVGAARTDGRTEGELSPIMYRTDRLQLLRSNTFWLSDTPDVPSSHWGNKFLRVCTWAQFRDLKTDKYFYLFNTHLDHQSQPSRVKSIALILEKIQQIKPQDPVILTGDFNAAEDNPVIAKVKNTGFRDTFRILHPDEKIVGTTNAFKPERQTNKIDYVFIDSNWETKAAKIIDDKIDGRWPSDHLPVTATLVQK